MLAALTPKHCELKWERGEQQGFLLPGCPADWEGAIGTISSCPKKRKNKIDAFLGTLRTVHPAGLVTFTHTSILPIDYVYPAELGSLHLPTFSPSGPPAHTPSSLHAEP